MEPLKHECGVAMIRLLKPLSYYQEKYGSYAYGLKMLYLLMEKQHNRGQEGAGIGVIKLNTPPGHEYIFRERALGTNAISEIYSNVGQKVDGFMSEPHSAEDIEAYAPFLGEIYMGHLRYSTTGHSGISYVHPFLRRNNWPSRNLLLCGNFNMTNVDDIIKDIVATGQHPRLYSDTVLLLDQLGHALDKENHRLYREYRDRVKEPELSALIEDNLDIVRILCNTAPQWDGGYVICGATGSGDMFALRDPHGIRPAFYYANDEVVVIASERPVIQTVFNQPIAHVCELKPGSAVIINKNGRVKVADVLGQRENKRCSFERIYFSRGSDASIYHERKALGRNLVPDVMKAIDYDLDNAVFSFIPNTAEVAFLGMCQGLYERLEECKTDEILRLQHKRELKIDSLRGVMSRRLRVEKIAVKDIKLRTFIAESDSRNELAAHVYDVTYGSIRPGSDTLLVIDDSIVRGTTLRQSIIGMLDRLQPKKIVIVSSSPQVRYPDYYGIDMSRMAEFIAFRAAVELIKESGRTSLLTTVYNNCINELKKPVTEQRNCVKAIYEPFTEAEISDKIAMMLTPEGTKAKVIIVYQTLKGLHDAVPGCPGDWYFSGDYPTPGGNRLVNQAFINYFEGKIQKR
ncbi:MAG: amidophosphoribosyltransferase [Muribaculaceae bacterium]|nr:amidophosphoribosyltransferase [Muribaculaceae bacterium]